MKTKSNSHKPHTFIAILISLFLGPWSINAQCPTVTEPNQSFCDVESLLVSDLDATDNGGGIAWYESATSTTPLPNNFPLTNGAVYYADDLTGACGTRPSVTVTIVGPPFGQNFQGFCIDDTDTVTLNDLNAVGNDVQWYDVAFGGTALPLDTELVNGSTYFADQANPETGCRTSRLAVSVTIGIVPIPTGESIQEFCLSPTNTPTVADLQATGNNQWYPTPFSALPYPPSTPLVDGQLYYATTVDPPCESTGRFPVLAIVNISPDPGEDGSLELCDIDSPVDLFTRLGGSPESGGVWSPALASGTSIFDPAVDPAGTYTYTLTGTAPCPDESAQVIVDVTIQEDAGISSTLDLCSDDTNTYDLFTILEGTPDSGGSWSPALASGGSIYDPLVDPAGVYTYTVGAGSLCPNSSTVTVQFTQAADAGTDGTLNLCSNESPVDLFTILRGSPETGGTWSPALASGTGVFDPAIDAEGTYTYTVLGTAPCPDATANVVVTVEPEANAGEDGSIELCNTDDPIDLFTQLGGIPDANGSWSPALASGTGVFDPSIDPEGTYTYTVIGSSPCPDDSAQVIVDIIPAPDAGEDASIDICESDGPIDLFDVLGGTPDTGGMWTPSLNSGTGVFDPTIDPSGTYTYTLIGTSPCPDDSAQVTVTIIPEPNAGEDALLDICSSGDPIDLFNLLGGTPQSGGSWTPALASGTGMFDPSLDSAGIYTYTVAGTAPCPDDSSQVNVTIIPEPNAGEDGVADLCTNAGTVDLFDALGGTPDTGGTWSPALASGTGIFDPEIDPEGIYTYTVTGTNPCPDDSAQVTVTFIDTPYAGEDGTLDICSSDAPVDLFLSLGGTPDTGGTWSPALNSGTGVFDPSIDAPGVYTYTVGSNCTDGADVTVNTIAEANAGEPGVLDICDPSITYDLFDALQGSPQPGGTWTPTLASGTGIFDPTVDSVGVYTYTVSGTDPCPDDSSEVTVRFTDPPNAGEDGAIELCINDDPVDLFTVLGGTPDSGGTWTPALSSGTGIFDPALDPPGPYTYTVGPNACDLSDESVVNVSLFPLPDAGENASIALCASDDPIDLFTVLGGTPNPGGSWSPELASGSGIFDPSIDAEGIYTYTTAPDSCGLRDSSEVAVSITETPDISGLIIDIDSPICIGDPVFVSFSGANNLQDGTYEVSYTITGANNVSNSMVLDFANGTSILEIASSDLPNAGDQNFAISSFVTELEQCPADITNLTPTSFTIEEELQPELSTNEAELCEEDSPTIADLDAFVIGSNPVLWYSSIDSEDPLDSTTNLEDGFTYYAGSISENGCVSRERAPLLVTIITCDLSIIVPDGFSPNGDTINDTFFIPKLRDLYPDFKLFVYNRYGNIIYKGDANIPDWDGRSNQGGLGSGILPVGVYFYVLEFNDGENDAVQGRVYLNR